MTRRARGLRALAFALTAVPAFSSAATQSNWVTATSGSWDDVTKWSTDPSYPNNDVPTGTSYDASITAAGGPYTVALGSSVLIDSLTLNSDQATINHSSGTLRAINGVAVLAGTYALSGGTIQNCMLAVAGGGQFRITNGLLDGVSMSGLVDMSQTFGSVTVRNGLTLNGSLLLGGEPGVSIASMYFGSGGVSSQTLGGSGTVVLGNWDITEHHSLCV